MSEDDPGPDRCPERRELLGLLRGELSPPAAFTVRDHLAGCPDCRVELVEVALGHSLLTSAARTLRDPVPVPLPEPPRSEVPHLRTAGRRRRVALVAVAAAAALVAGGVTVGALVGDDERAPARPPVAAPLQEADLEAVGPVPGRGVVRMAAGGRAVAEMTVQTRALPRPRAGDYYYVWLLDPDTNKMLPVGQVEAEGSTTFRLPLSLLGRYTAIDVSLETDDGDPGHSPTSVLRAGYTPPETARS